MKSHFNLEQKTEFSIDYTIDPYLEREASYLQVKTL